MEFRGRNMTCLYVELSPSRSNRSQYKRTLVLQCDQCDVIFTRRWVSGHDSGDHYHDQACKSAAMKVGGKLNARLQQTCVERWGVAYPLLADVNKNKARKTCLKNHGVENVLLRHDVRTKALERSSSPEARKKRNNALQRSAKARLAKGKETLRARYNVDHNFQIDQVKTSRCQTWIKRYGVDNPFSSTSVREKIKTTLLERYGVQYYVQTDAFKQCMVETAKERSAKTHATMKKNGSYGTSRVENVCHECLCQLYGQENIERQVWIHKWPIDFYVKSLDVYVQFDGVYWHGLDRPIEEIEKLKNKRDVVILRTVRSDVDQARWFSTHDKRLVRITDLAFRNALRKIV